MSGRSGSTSGRDARSKSLDEQIAVIDRRVQTRRAETRAELERVGLLADLDALKAVFPINGSSFWLRTDRMEVGPKPVYGPVITWNNPIRSKKRGKNR